jgi:hypothetical protein
VFSLAVLVDQKSVPDLSDLFAIFLFLMLVIRDVKAFIFGNWMRCARVSQYFDHKIYRYFRQPNLKEGSTRESASAIMGRGDGNGTFISFIHDHVLKKINEQLPTF